MTGESGRVEVAKPKRISHEGTKAQRHAEAAAKLKVKKI
jgi:hypothetical protein